MYKPSGSASTKYTWFSSCKSPSPAPFQSQACGGVRHSYPPSFRHLVIFRADFVYRHCEFRIIKVCHLSIFSADVVFVASKKCPASSAARADLYLSLLLIPPLSLHPSSCHSIMPGQMFCISSLLIPPKSARYKSCPVRVSFSHLLIPP